MSYFDFPAGWQQGGNRQGQGQGWGNQQQQGGWGQQQQPGGYNPQQQGGWGQQQQGGWGQQQQGGWSQPPQPQPPAQGGSGNSFFGGSNVPEKATEGFSDFANQLFGMFSGDAFFNVQPKKPPQKTDDIWSAGPRNQYGGAQQQYNYGGGGYQQPSYPQPSYPQPGYQPSGYQQPGYQQPNRYGGQSRKKNDNMFYYNFLDSFENMFGANYRYNYQDGYDRDQSDKLDDFINKNNKSIADNFKPVTPKPTPVNPNVVDPGNTMISGVFGNYTPAPMREEKNDIINYGNKPMIFNNSFIETFQNDKTSVLVDDLQELVAQSTKLGKARQMAGSGKFTDSEFPPRSSPSSVSARAE